MVALKQGSVPDVIANKLDHLLILTSGTEQYLITCTNKKYKFLLTTTLTISVFHCYLPAGLPFYYRVLPLRSRGIDPAVSQQRSSSGRNRKSSSSSHIHPNL